jgi:hypothetical protein
MIDDTSNLDSRITRGLLIVFNTFHFVEGEDLTIGERSFGRGNGKRIGRSVVIGEIDLSGGTRELSSARG